MLALYIVGGIVLAIVLKPTAGKVISAASAVVLAFAWLAVDFFYWRCPACADRLGAKRYPEFCWNCGAELNRPSGRWTFGQRRFWRCQACGAQATINREPHFCWTCGIELRDSKR